MRTAKKENYEFDVVGIGGGLSGICAAIGGMIMLANYNSARSDYGSVYTMQCILIVVLGGVDPKGGRGKISGVLMAIVLLRLLETGINRFPQISSYYITLIWGAVLLLVIDGRQVNSMGASLADLIDVMMQFGAVNAANLDGGSSSKMYYQGEFVNDGVALTGSRRLPTAFIVK